MIYQRSYLAYISGESDLLLPLGVKPDRDTVVLCGHYCTDMLDGIVLLEDRDFASITGAHLRQLPIFDFRKGQKYGKEIIRSVANNRSAQLRIKTSIEDCNYQAVERVVAKAPNHMIGITNILFIREDIHQSITAQSYSVKEF